MRSAGAILILALAAAVRAGSLYEQSIVKTLEQQFPETGISYLLIDSQTRAVMAARWEDAQEPVAVGSLIKPFTALAYGELHGYRYPEYVCRGRASGCWLPRGHGRVDLAEAIAHSCNAYFLALASAMPSRAIRCFGIGPPDGSSPETPAGLGDLADRAEEPGAAETPRSMSRSGAIRRFGIDGPPEDSSPETPAGQGDVADRAEEPGAAETPRSMSRSGAIRRFGIDGPPPGSSPETLAGLGDGWKIAPLALVRAYCELAARAEEPDAAEILRGMALSARRGTGSGVSRLLGETVLAKTGTAPCSHTRRSPGDGYTVVLYPPERPRVALLVRVHGTTGAQTAAIAGRMLRVVLKGQ